MAGLSIQHADGLYLPELNLWFDPHEPHTGPERVFVSHAHSDHVAAHREIILSEPTARLMQARVPGVRQEHVLAFGARRRLGEGTAAFDLTLLPAGHIFGSAMALVQARGESLLYTGDFKLRRGLSAEACEPRPAEVLVMETTFGRPHYRFPPTTEVLEGIVRFCREALDNDETAVLFGYSLGKSQELLCSLGNAGLPLMLHGAVWKLTEIYRQFGHCFPPYEHYEPGAALGKVLLCPPNVVNSAMLRKLGRVRTAILTGWALDPNCRFRYQCDAAFPLSDHADFPELLQLVQLVHPRRVYTLHGFAAEFAQTLCEQGYDARALTQTEQLGLPLVAAPSNPATPPAKPALPACERKVDAAAPAATSASAFDEFALTCSRIAAVQAKLEKIRFLAEYLRRLDSRTTGIVTTWFAGRPFPANQNRVLQLGWAVIRDAVCAVASCEEMHFHQVYLKHSDLGSTAEEMLLSHRGLPGPTVRDVQSLFERLQAARGPLAKTPMLASALAACSPVSVKYLVKIITGDLRIGLKEGLVEQAIAAAFGCAEEEVRHANLLLGDIGETARLAAENGLRHVEMVPFRPIKFMLASPEPTAEAIWERLRERKAAQDASGEHPELDPTPDHAPEEPFTAWVEDKYDGIRAQLHKVDRRVEFYSRDLKEITATFTELADSVRGLQPDMILDGEIVAMRREKVLPFAELQKRLGRRQRDLFMREEVPVVFMAFDLLWLNGDTLLNTPLRERRRKLESLTPLPSVLQLARVTRVASAAEIDAAFDSARARGNEGLMIKDPLSAYTPGRQGLAWLKLKKALATLDCVVIGAEYGHGKRNKVLSDYTFAVRDEDTGELVTIGKAYTGLTDIEIAALTEHFLRTATRQHGRYFEVPPDTVLEIAFDRIQHSTRHNSGLALRFPRIVRVRTDKAVADIDTLSTARRLAARSTDDSGSVTQPGQA